MTQKDDSLKCHDRKYNGKAMQSECLMSKCQITNSSWSKHSLFFESVDDIFELCFNDGNYNTNFELNPRSWIVVMVTFLCIEYALNRIAIGRHSSEYDFGM